jgi:sulfur-oxidizing protein SoxZ
MPATAKSGDVVEIRALILHPMITGHGSGGPNSVPRKIIHTFVATFEGEEIFRAEMFPGIAANPSLVFTTVAERTGDITFTWIGDGDERIVEARRLTVT